MLATVNTSSQFLAQANGEGARGYSFGGFTTFGNAYIKDNSRSATFAYEMLATVNTSPQLLTQANGEGARGYSFGGFTTFGNLYVKDNSLGTTFSYEALALTSTASAFIAQATAEGSRGYSYLGPTTFGNLYVTTTQAPPTTFGVVEFYNTILDNYFITADSGEAAAIDNGSAGPGWIRTGNTFKSSGSTYVCRFYGSQSPGPNSHFYTADPGECAYLRQLQASTPATEKRWNFESLDFQTTVAVSGICPSGKVPVYRAYNNGFARGVDSNHRITSSLTAIQQVVARGWGNEGVVMCAPQ